VVGLVGADAYQAPPSGRRTLSRPTAIAGICPSLQAITFSRYPFDDAVPADIRV